MENSRLRPVRHFGWPSLAAAFVLGAALAGAGTAIIMRPPAPNSQTAAVKSTSPRTIVPVALKAGTATGTLSLALPDMHAGNNRLPLDNTCYRDNVSPALSWRGAPVGTQSFVVLFARSVGHAEALNWAVFDIPASATGLSAGQPKASPKLPDGALQAHNDRGAFAYVGPCEPHGVIPYVFHLYALDRKLGLAGDIDKNVLFAAMNGHILDSVAVPVIHDLHYLAVSKSSAAIPVKSGTDRPPARNPPR